MHPQLSGLGPGRNLRQQTFIVLQNTAKSIVVSIHAHRHPATDQAENLKHQIEGMQQGIKLYCSVPAAALVLRSYNDAKAAVVKLFQACKAYKQHADEKSEHLIESLVDQILRDMNTIVHATFV